MMEIRRDNSQWSYSKKDCDFRSCAQCDYRGHKHALRLDQEEGQWYCSSCWELWESGLAYSVASDSTDNCGFPFKLVDEKSDFRFDLAADTTRFGFGDTSGQKDTRGFRSENLANIQPKVELDFGREFDEDQEMTTEQAEQFKQERDALIALRNSLKVQKKGWIGLDFYSKRSQLSQCAGVATEGGAVVSIDLRGQQLEGCLPKEIGDLQQLRVLNLASTNIAGSLPDEFAALTNLEEAYLSCNSLSGPMPENLEHMTNLRKLFVGRNKFEGAVPWVSLEKLVQQHALKKIYLGGNSFDALQKESLKAAVGGMTKLQAIDLVGMVDKADREDAEKLIKEKLPDCTTIYI